jgi:AraC family transcriptional regulator of adaptative response/methylated-DNA-[protein]-cysteine methyltransferase
MGLALGELRSGANALRVGLDHGYDSASGFRDAFERVFNASPGRSGNVDCVVTAVFESPIGPLVAGATHEGVCLLEFADRPAFERQVRTLRHRLNATIVPGHNEHLEQLTDELRRYFAGELTGFSIPLVTPGTEFQRCVWARLGRIPFGTTLSYGELAADIGRPGAQRAVGRANGDNRIAIVIPCHRVVQSDGKLRGYGGGLWRKQFLLDHERDRSNGKNVPETARQHNGSRPEYPRHAEGERRRST